MTVLLTIYTAFGGKPAGRVNSVVITVDQKNFARSGFTNIQISPGSGPEAGTFVEKDNLSAEAGKDNQSQPGPAGVPYFISGTPRRPGYRGIPSELVMFWAQNGMMRPSGRTIWMQQYLSRSVSRLRAS